MSYRSHVAAPSRVFDHLYDPVFTTSDPKNIYKENCVALTRSAPIRVYPVYNSMFSELCYEERNCYAYQKNFLPVLLSPSNSQKAKFTSVTGAERSKFFSNPISNLRTINVGLMADKYKENVEDSDKHYRNISIQTLYRESSAQTKSWLPECFTEEISVDVPEVVYVADIIETVSYPGLKEVEIIERARKRRAWEMTLPPIKNVEEIPKRVAALEAFEWEEWVAREKDINECQQARLQIVANLIEKREKEHKSAADLKIQNCRKRTLVERNRQKELLINSFQRNMRKIDLAKRRDIMKNTKNDPVLIHYDKKSDYAIPNIKIGMSKNKKRSQIEYSNDFKNRFNLLEQDNVATRNIENYLKPNKTQLWMPKQPSKEIERGIWNENYLKRLHETLKNFRRKKDCKRRHIEKNLSNETESTLTSLPIQAFDDQTDENYQNNTFIQKAIKGRAIQSMLRKGIKKFQDVIQEAKETNSIAAVRKLFPKEFSHQIDCQEEIMQEYRRIDELLKNDEKLQEQLKKIESKDVRKLLNYFGKELNRLQIEKQGHALYLLAERERYRREAEKLGELSCEEQFKNDAVTLYLENILLEGINRTFDDSSRNIIREMAQKIDSRASKVIKFNENVEEFSCKSSLDDENLEEIENDSQLAYHKFVTDLKKDTMIPHIINEFKNNKLISIQREYLINAHQYLYKDEFEKAKKEEDYYVCFTIYNEILENAMISDLKICEKINTLQREDSLEAELLATQIVEEILNDIIDNKIEELRSENSQETDAKSEDGFNSKSISETESSDDLLAEIVTYDVLNDILEGKTSSESETSETNELK